MRRAAAICAAMVLASHATFAAESASVFTPFNIASCQEVDAANPDEGYGGSFMCDGHAELKIFWSGRDNRNSVAFGKQPQSHCAAKQTFSQFNTAGEKLEWRLHNDIPVATILRWTVTRDIDGKIDKKEWLAVARLEQQNSCVLALIDSAWPNASDKARKVADEIAGEGFGCVGSTLRTFANEGTDVDVEAFGPACQAE